MPWYALNGRHELPWRLTRDPYLVLVSEVMLQQTQVERVLPYYRRWIEHWPTVAALGAATPGDVIREWAGLGYNRRSLNLHRLAIDVSRRFDGIIPRDVAALLTLPGVGQYTAAAVASFAFEQPVAVADTNIARVIARAGLGVANQRLASSTALHAATGAWLPSAGVRDHNLALMDLGAMVCGARTPRCDACPLAGICQWRLAGLPASDPPVKRSTAFEDTARFARGRIVDALRDRRVLLEIELKALLPARHAAQLPAYLTALEHDGLVERLPAGAWALPGDGADSRQ